MNARNVPKRIIVIGFMGTGKTTVARILARRLKMRFRDCDRWIEKARRKSVRRIFADEGEKSFRRLESKALNTLLKEKRLVLATGGGIVLSAANRRRIRKAGFVIWIKASRAMIWKRVQKSRQRPLLNVPAPRQAIARLMNRREALYRVCADTIVQNNGHRPHAGVSALIRRHRWSLS